MTEEVEAVLWYVVIFILLLAAVTFMEVLVIIFIGGLMGFAVSWKMALGVALATSMAHYFIRGLRR